MTTSLMRGLPRRDTWRHSSVTRDLEPLPVVTGTMRSVLEYTPMTDDVLLGSVGSTPLRASCDLGTWMAMVWVL